MCAAIVLGRAAVGIAGVRIHVMIVNVISVHVVHVAVMEIIGVSLVAHRSMTAVRSVHVGVPLMFFARSCHLYALHADDALKGFWGQLVSGLIPGASG